jgi:hypothetical protein
MVTIILAFFNPYLDYVMPLLEILRRIIHLTSKTNSLSSSL